MLEEHQTMLISGIRDLYQRLLDGESWPGSPISESRDGNPLTHEILERLGVLTDASEQSGADSPVFEEDLKEMQRRLIERGAGLVSPRRRRSFSPESVHSHSKKDH